MEDKTKAESDEERVATSPTSREYPPVGSTGQDVPIAPETVQYAVVKKALRKTRSLSECMVASQMLELVQEHTDRATPTEVSR